MYDLIKWSFMEASREVSIHIISNLQSFAVAIVSLVFIDKW
jgi:hypothetical protein